MQPLAKFSWAVQGEPVYKLQKISPTKARYIAIANGGAFYGLFIIEPASDSQTRIKSNDFGAVEVNHKKHFDVLSSW